MPLVRTTGDTSHMRACTDAQTHVCAYTHTYTHTHTHTHKHTHTQTHTHTHTHTQDRQTHKYLYVLSHMACNGEIDVAGDLVAAGIGSLLASRNSQLVSRSNPLTNMANASCQVCSQNREKKEILQRIFRPERRTRVGLEKMSFKMKNNAVLKYAMSKAHPHVRACTHTQKSTQKHNA